MTEPDHNTLPEDEETSLTANALKAMALSLIHISEPTRPY